MKQDKTIIFKDSTYKVLKIIEKILGLFLIIFGLYILFSVVYFENDINLFFLKSVIFASIVFMVLVAIIIFLQKPIVLNASDKKHQKFKYMVERHNIFFLSIIAIIICLIFSNIRSGVSNVFISIFDYLRDTIVLFSNLNVSTNIVLECKNNISYIANLIEMQSQMIDIWLFVMTIFITIMLSKIFYFDKKLKESLKEELTKDTLEGSEFFLKKLGINILLISIITVSIYFVFLHTTNKLNLLSFSSNFLVTETACKTSIYEILNSTILSHNVLFIGLSFFTIYFLIIKYVVINIFIYLLILGKDIFAIFIKIK